MTKQLKKVTFQVEIDGISVPAYSQAMAKKYRQAPRIVFQGDNLNEQLYNANERISQVGLCVESMKLPNGATLLARSPVYKKVKGFNPVTILLAEWGDDFVTWECYSEGMADTSQGDYFNFRYEKEGFPSRAEVLPVAIEAYKARCARESNRSL